MKPSAAQIKALKKVEKRDWPAGEPRIDWLNKSTAQVLLRQGLIVERQGTSTHYGEHQTRGNIVDLTTAGRAALSST